MYVVTEKSNYYCPNYKANKRQSWDLDPKIPTPEFLTLLWVPIHTCFSLYLSTHLSGTAICDFPFSSVWSDFSSNKKGGKLKRKIAKGGLFVRPLHHPYSLLKDMPLNVVSRHLRIHWASPVLELETEEDARCFETVCGQRHSSGRVSLPNSPFLLHYWVSVPFCPHQKPRCSLLHLAHWLALPENTSLNYSDDKTFRLSLEPTSSALLWSL